MTRIAAATLALLSTFSAYAITSGDASPPPPPAINTLGVVIFLVLFFGSCAGFVWLVLSNEKKNRDKAD
jgi:hypothetical protein